MLWEKSPGLVGIVATTLNAERKRPFTLDKRTGVHFGFLAGAKITFFFDTNLLSCPFSACTELSTFSAVFASFSTTPFYCFYLLLKIDIRNQGRLAPNSIAMQTDHEIVD